MTYTLHFDLANGKGLDLAGLEETDMKHVLSAVQCRADSNYVSNPFISIRNGQQLLNCKDIVLVTVKEDEK